MIDWLSRLFLRKNEAAETVREEPIQGKTRDADGQQLKQTGNDVVISHVGFYAETLKNPNADYLSRDDRRPRTRRRRRRR